MLKGKSMLLLTQLGVFDVDTNLIYFKYTPPVFYLRMPTNTILIPEMFNF